MIDELLDITFIIKNGISGVLPETSDIKIYKTTFIDGGIK